MGRRILIVDDIATNRIVLKVKLAAACYDTAQAATGAEALRRATADRPDLILLDLGLPDMDGLDVLRRLRRDPGTRAIPVIVISARSGAEARISALDAGADEILPKPVDDPVLLARVRSLLRARERDGAPDLGPDETGAAPVGWTGRPPRGWAEADAPQGAGGDGVSGLGVSGLGVLGEGASLSRARPGGAARADMPRLTPITGGGDDAGADGASGAGAVAEAGVSSHEAGRPGELAEAAAPFEQPGLIALIARDEEEALGWRRRLQPLLPDRMVILNGETALAAASRAAPETVAGAGAQTGSTTGATAGAMAGATGRATGAAADGGPASRRSLHGGAAEAAAPDLFVISADLRRAGDGLRLMSELRSRPGSLHAGICIVLPTGDRDTAAMALDLGANDLLPAEATAQEIALRLRMQMRQKQSGDRGRRQMQDRLRLAMQDPLTGLYNRHYALPQLARIAERARRSGQPYAVLLLDLDRFKSVNDRHGHVAGDHVLAEAASRLRASLRPMDLLARIGGEEFLVVLPDVAADRAGRMAERLRRAIEAEPFALPDGSGALRMTVSVGVALEEAGSNPEAAWGDAADAPLNRTIASEAAANGGAAVNAPLEAPSRAARPACHCEAAPRPAAPVAGRLPSGSVIDRADQALLSAKARGRNRVMICGHPA